MVSFQILWAEPHLYTQNTSYSLGDCLDIAVLILEKNPSGFYTQNTSYSLGDCLDIAVLILEKNPSGFEKVLEGVTGFT
jgi:hypothetical protein